MKRATALVGDTHYDLTYLGEGDPRPMPSGGVKYMARVRCLCGVEFQVQWSNIVANKCRSCLNCSAKGRNLGKKKFGGDAVNRKQAMWAYQRGAKKRGLLWDLTTEQFDALTAEACFYCGLPPSNVYFLKNKDGAPRAGDPFVYSGIDRIDAGRGYTPDNTVPCCTICNMAKMDRPLHEMIAWAARFLNKMMEHENGTSLASRTVFSEEVWRNARRILDDS
jgi:hypothetical protein